MGTLFLKGLPGRITAGARTGLGQRVVRSTRPALPREQRIRQLAAANSTRESTVNQRLWSSFPPPAASGTRPRTARLVAADTPSIRVSSLQVVVQNSQFSEQGCTPR
jgi:hypothetical protein